MVKTRTTLTIEKDIYEKAKKHIPNISEFVEECIKQYLGLADGVYPTAEAKEIVNEISLLQAKLYILNQNADLEQGMREIEEEKINRPWRFLFHDYRRRCNINQQFFEDALKVLPVDAETLEDVLDFAECNQDNLSLNCTWAEVWSKYQKEMEE